MRAYLLPFVTALVLALVGCNTEKHATREPAPNSDLAELRLIVADALITLRPTLETLDDLDQLEGPCPPQLLNRFGTDIQRLQTDSLKFRAQLQAMQVRGKPYFEERQEHPAGVNAGEANNRPNERHEQLERSFANIQQKSQRTGAALEVFLSETRTLRRALERESATNMSDSTKELIRRGRADGLRAQEELEGLERELEVFNASG